MIGILESLFLGVIQLILVFLDVIAFLLVARLLSVRWPTTAAFIALDRIGTPVVDPMLQAVGRMIPGVLNPYGVKRRIGPPFIILMAIEIVRLGITTMGRRGL